MDFIADVMAVLLFPFRNIRQRAHSDGTEVVSDRLIVSKILRYF